MTDVKAIETRYAGCRFRSRLEARWAVFFDRLGVRWEYEAEGYETPAGGYLPDFLLHLRWPTLFEVKPENFTGQDERWQHMPHRLIIARGMPRPGRWMDLGFEDWSPFIDEDGNRTAVWDCNYGFCICPWCGAVGIEFDGRGGRVCGHGAHPAGWVTCGKNTAYDDRAHSGDHSRIVRAYRAARSARFEHGETPTT